jgi:2-methylcitrate dehydratase PrpD
MIKSVAVGLALARALEAAELAGLGVSATEDALETVLGHLQPHTGSGFDAAPLEQLGRRWTLTHNMLKLHPAQINTQAAVEAALSLHKQGIRMEQVRRLVLHGHRRVAAGIQGSAEAFAPTTREAADHSTPYVVAMALLRGRLTLQEFEGSPWEVSEVKTALAKIELVIDPAMDKIFDNEGFLGARLVAELNDGRIVEALVHQPKGHPEAPLSEAELLEKMTWLLQASAPALHPQRLLDLCNRLSTIEDIVQLVEICRVERT